MNLNNMLMNSLLGQLKKQNPQQYQTLVSLMNSGKTPEQVLNELLANGVFTQEQINSAMNAASNNQQRNPRRF